MCQAMASPSRSGSVARKTLSAPCGGLLELVEHLLLALDDLVLGLEAVLHVHAHLALGQVLDVAHGGLHRVAGAQVLLDGLRLGGRLHHHQVVRALAPLGGSRLRLAVPGGGLTTARAPFRPWRRGGLLGGRLLLGRAFLAAAFLAPPASWPPSCGRRLLGPPLVPARLPSSSCASAMTLSSQTFSYSLSRVLHHQPELQLHQRAGERRRREPARPPAPHRMPRGPVRQPVGRPRFRRERLPQRSPAPAGTAVAGMTPRPATRLRRRGRAGRMPRADEHVAAQRRLVAHVPRAGRAPGAPAPRAASAVYRLPGALAGPEHQHRIRRARDESVSPGERRACSPGRPAAAR